MCYKPVSLSGHLVEKHLPPVDLYWNRGEYKNTNKYKSQRFCCLPLYLNPWIFTCSSNWKFFSKTRSMWSRKAECSCSCRFPRLSFNMKRKMSQVVERLPKWGWWWDILLKQNFNNFAYLSQSGLQGEWPVPGPFSSFRILQYPWDTYRESGHYQNSQHWFPSLPWEYMTEG